MSLKNSFLVAASMAVALLLTARAAQAQTPTAFTYQGQLSSTGTPLTGPADLRAQLFTAATGGSPVGAAIDLPNTSVTNGLFTVLLDFGNAFDAGQPRWVEVSVRSPAGTGSFTTLSPRQPLTPAPLARGLAGISITRGGVEALDQAQDVSAGSNGSPPSWQSWTAGATGNLTRIQLALDSGLPASFTVRVRRGLGTGGPVLGESSTVVNSSTPVSNFSLPNIPIESGKVYTMEFIPQNISMRLAAVRIPGATGRLGGTEVDWWFRTYVTSPTMLSVTASNVPWAGITGVPDNVANGFTPWISTANGISYPQGAIGIGTPTPGARMEINAGAADGLLVRTSNSSPWALRIGNDIATAAGFQTGMFMTDSGFFRITNRIANPNGTYAQLGTNGAWTALSDARLKTDVTTAEGNLAAALKLRPVNFRWKSDGSADFGLIAQEVRDVLPRLVTGNESNDSLTLNYSQLSVVAIGAIQEQQAQRNADRTEIERLARENADLKARLAAIEAALLKINK